MKRFVITPDFTIAIPLDKLDYLRIKKIDGEYIIVACVGGKVLDMCSYSFKENAVEELKKMITKIAECEVK